MAALGRRELGGAVDLDRELAESRAREAALSEVLGVMSRVPPDLQAVLDTVVTRAAQLCDAEFDGTLYLVEGDRFHLAAGTPNASPKMLEWREEAQKGQPLEKGWIVPTVARSKAVFHVLDASLESDTEWGRQDALDQGYRSILGVPLLRGDEVIGVLSLLRAEVRAFADQEIELVRAFADQAAIAIENARLTTATNEALERQIAVSQVLEAMSETSKDLTHVFRTIVEQAVQLCRADNASIFRADGDFYRHIASATGSGLFANEPLFKRLAAEAARDSQLVKERNTLVGRVLIDKAPVQIVDIFADPEYDTGRAVKFMIALAGQQARTILGVPIMKGAAVVGIIIARRNDVRGFSEREIGVLETFARQAAIAIENGRLFNEIKEGLERQTAIAQVLEAMSESATDLTRMFTAIAENAVQLCGAKNVSVRRAENGTAWLVALAGEFADRSSFQLGHRGPIFPGRTTLVGRVLLERRTVQIDDILADPEYDQSQVVRVEGTRTVLGVPILRDDQVLGMIVARRSTVSPFAQREIEILETFASQAAIALENVRLFNETKEALERQTALSEILRAIAASPTNVAPVLDAIAVNAARFCGAEDAAVMLVRGDEMFVVAHHGPIGTLGGVPLRFDRTAVAGVAVMDRRTVHVPDVFAPEAAEFTQARERAAETGQRGMLATPLVREDAAFGAVLLRKSQPTPFTPKQIALVEAFAHQAVIAIENVRLFNETKESLEQQTATREVLEVISASAFDLDVVFRTIVENAVRLCRADNASFLRPDGDLFIQVANAGEFEDAEAYERVWRDRRFVADRGSLSGRVILARHTVQIEDVLADAEYDKAHLVLDVRTMLGVPVLHDRRVIGIIVVRRKEVRPFNTREIEILETFAHQAAIAIENVRLFNETKEALERQTATAEILKVISASPSDLQPVFDSIGEHARVLCGAERVHLWLRKGDRLELVATGRDPAVELDLIRARSLPVDRSNMAGRAILGRVTIHVPDVLADPEYDARIQEGAHPWRTVLAVPLIRDGEGIGAIALLRSAATPFEDRQIELVRTFADQAVIAIENVRLFNETKEALEQQSAISEVLTAIARATSDPQPVFDVVLRRAMELCDADQAVLRRRDGEFGVIVAAQSKSQPGWSATVLGSRMPIEQVIPGSRLVAMDLEVVHVPDIGKDPEFSRHPAVVGGHFRPKTALGVAVRTDERIWGWLALQRMEVRPYSDREIDLVRTFAAQAGLAIENVRLFNETKEALEQQTAVADVLKTISRSAFDLQPVLDIVLENAVRLAGADIGWLSRVEGEHFKTVAYSSKFPEDVKRDLIERRAQWHAGGGWVPLGSEGGIMGRVTADRRTLRLADVKVDPELRNSLVARLTEARTIVGVPMVRDERAIGGIVLARYAVQPFSDREVELVQTFTDQAAIAIENVRLFDETKESLERQSAVSEVLKTISRTVFDLGPTLQTVVENAARLCDADLAWMTQRVEATNRTAFGFGARWGRTPDLAQRFEQEAVRTSLYELTLTESWTTAPPARSIMGRIYREKHAMRVDDIMNEAELDRSLVAFATGARSVLGVPVLRDEEALGAIVLARTAVRPFTQREVQLVETFADQAAIAIRNVRLFNEIQDKSRQLEVASRHKSEFLANMSHELRTPLNAIIGFSEVMLERIFGDLNAKQEEYLRDVLSSGRHLLTLINDILDLSKIEAGRMELERGVFSLRTALENGATMVRERASRHGIALELDAGEGLEAVSGDERKVKQVIYNLLSNAVKFTADGGRVAVRAARDDGAVKVTVRDTGIGIAPEDQERIFEEFSQVGRDPERSREGTGLGLTLSKRYVELHGGRLWVESAPGEGSTFTFTLPQP